MPSKNQVEVVCITCGNTFSVQKYRETSAKFCSNSCRTFPTTTEKATTIANIEKCKRCGKPFKKVTGQKEKFCNRECYLQWEYDQKPCKDCGKERCREHSRRKQAQWRKAADKKELKAKSIQIAYRKASGQTLTLPEARVIINDPPVCPYCELPIPWSELSIDHKIPISREGKSEPDNLVWTDWDCNRMKGNLLPEEFKLVVKFMNENPEIKKYLETRLKAGSGFIYKRKSF